MEREFTAHYDGSVLVPDEDPGLRTGEAVTLRVVDRPGAAPGDELTVERLLAVVAQVAHLPRDPNAPTDFAAQYEHYLHGTPRQE